MAQVKSTVNKTLDRFGWLDIVYSNAASCKLGSATDISEADWDYTQAACLKASRMIAHCAIAMLRSGSGVFIITASVQSVRGYTKRSISRGEEWTPRSEARPSGKLRAENARECNPAGPAITCIAAGFSKRESERIAIMCPLRRNAPAGRDCDRGAVSCARPCSVHNGSMCGCHGGLSSAIKTD